MPGPKPRDRTGDRVGILTLVSPHHRKDGPKGAWFWNSICDCGNSYIHRVGGHARSCGCIKKPPTRLSHGMRRTREYQSWASMKQRCLNPKNPKYPSYGGRGITICKRWLHSFENFFADMGERPAGKTLDRINNDGNYEPANCRWECPVQQANNRRARTSFNMHQNSLANLRPMTK